MKWKNKFRIVGNGLFHILILLLIILSFSLNWGINNYGNIGFAEIVFTLNMPLMGTSDSLINSYISDGLIPAAIVSVVWLLLFLWPAKNTYLMEMRVGKKSFEIRLFPFRLKAWIKLFILVCWTALLVIIADKSFEFCDYIVSQIQQSKLIEEEYVDPAETSIVFPEEKRNLIMIYIESGETTAQDTANGGVFENNYIPEMTQIARDNISFSQSELIEGACVAPATGWTMAALVAETSGLPLKMWEYDDTSGADNAMRKYATFMPGATTLGDILEEQGYKNVFMAGSNFKFGGRTNYFTQHGNYEIWDYVYAKEIGKIPEDYKVWWGFEDEKLYTYAKEEILKLAEGDQPFNFSMLTVDTHHQNGYVCELCEDLWGDQYANVWSCASKQLNEFVEWLKQQDFYENTTVVIVGDHGSMDSDFYADLKYEKHEGDTVRKVYNAFVNPAVEPVNEKNRQFTTLDFFPTILASLGVEIEGERLGLGTNLFSEEETLSEKYGYEYLFTELNKKSRFYDYEILYP